MPAFNDRTGEIRVMKNGLKAEIIAYRGATDIDVKFEDGYIARHKQYSNFKKNTIQHPKPPVCTKSDAGRFIGMEGKNGCGIKMVITGYRNSRDIDVTFEDGTVVLHKELTNFRTGDIAHPNIDYQQLSKAKYAQKLIGTKGKNTSGYEMEIVAYRGTGDIDVRFRNNSYVRHTRMNQFRSGHIKEPPEAKIGEKSVSKNGEEITLVRYESNAKVTVQFADGTLKDTSYCHFTSGEVANPNNPYKPKLRSNHLGETRSMNNGVKATVTAYRSANDMDLLTEEGAHISHVTYYRFKRGEVDTTDYSARIGEEQISHCGLKAKVIRYENSSSHGTTIQFEDGVTMDLSYQRFCAGEYAHPILKTRKKCVYCGYECLYAFEENGIVYYNTRNLKTGEQDILTPQQMYKKGE